MSPLRATGVRFEPMYIYMRIIYFFYYNYIINKS